MKILADESVDNEIVLRLRNDGHDVGYVAEMSPGIMDEEVLVLARDENTLLLTADKDFGKLIFVRDMSNAESFYITLQDSLLRKKLRLFPPRLPNTHMNYFRLLV